MQKNSHKIQKLKLAYVNFFSMPTVKDEFFKLKKYSFAFDFLFLLQEKFNITVFDFIGVNKSFSKKGVQFNYLKRSHNNKSFFPWKMFFKIKKLNPDVVYIQGLVYPHYILVLQLLIKPSSKIIVQDHKNSFPKGLKKRVFKLADRVVDYYLFTSKLMANKHLNEGLIFSEKKIVECVEGATNFNFNQNIKKEELDFLWVGRLNRNKDPITILRGFELFAVNNPKARLTMFYENEELLEDVKSFVKLNNLTQKVFLKGRLAHKELEYWYQKSSFFMLGSHEEGGPISLIEAMACGCIPIVTDIAPFQAMTNNGDCGLLFSPGDFEGLSSQLNKLEDLDIEKLREKTLNQFKGHLSHRAIASKITKAVLGI